MSTADVYIHVLDNASVADFTHHFGYTTILTKFDKRDFAKCSMSSFVVPLAGNKEINEQTL